MVREIKKKQKQEIKMKERQRDRRLKSAGLPFNMIVHETEPNMTKMSFYQPLHGRVTEETFEYEED